MIFSMIHLVWEVFLFDLMSGMKPLL
jgi:hypothetical protein